MSHLLTWNGHSNFTLRADGLTLLIDPFFDGNPMAILSAAKVGKVDYVLVTHDHGDHVGQAVEICKTTGAKLLAIVETCAKLVSQGLPQDQVVNGIGVNIGGTADLGLIRATMTQAVHSSESGLPVGYILTLADGYTVYHMGDTGLFGAMELYGRLYNIDLALMPIGGTFTMDPRQAALACELLNCKAVIPMHWGTFPVLESGTENFAKEIETRELRTNLIPCRPGESVALDRSSIACGC